MKNKVNEIIVSYKEKQAISKAPTITSSLVAGKLLYESWDKDTISLKETFKVLLLNNSNKVKGIYELSQGGITGTLVDLRVLYAVILKSLSVAVILAHNHPSGKLTPSEADKHLTRKIVKAGNYFDVKVLDHLIVVPNGAYYSFADNGLL